MFLKKATIDMKHHYICSADNMCHIRFHEVKTPVDGEFNITIKRDIDNTVIVDIVNAVVLRVNLMDNTIDISDLANNNVEVNSIEYLPDKLVRIDFVDFIIYIECMRDKEDLIIGIEESLVKSKKIQLIFDVSWLKQDTKGENTESIS